MPPPWRICNVGHMDENVSGIFLRDASGTESSLCCVSPEGIAVPVRAVVL